MRPGLIALSLLLILVVPSQVARAQSQELGDYVVTANRLNIRSGPGSQYPNQGRVRLGEKVTVHAWSEGWARISGSQGHQGWAHGSYLSKASASEKPAIRQGGDQPYSFRKFNLGMPLSQFRNTVHPDGDNWPNAFVVCSNDLQKTSVNRPIPPSLSIDWEKSGIILCEYRYKYGYTYVEIGIILASVPVFSKFYFIKDHDGVHKLFYMLFTVNNAKYNKIVGGYVEKFGPPHDIKGETFQNQMGATFYNTKSTWSNGASTIEINKLSEEVHIMSVEYSYITLFELLGQRLDSLTGKATDTL